MPRTGSSLLCALLNSHPQIACHSELFNGYRAVGLNKPIKALLDKDWRMREPLAWLDQVMSETALIFPDAQAAGFKLHLHDRLSVLAHLLMESRIKLIVLARENRLAQYASWIQSRQTQRYTFDNRGREEPRKLAFCNDAFHTFLKNQSMAYGLIDCLINDPARILNVEYRDLTKARSHDRLCEFLGVACRPLQARDQRMGASDLRQRFADPEQVERELAHTIWRSWLDRPGS